MILKTLHFYSFKIKKKKKKFLLQSELFCAKSHCIWIHNYTTNICIVINNNYYIKTELWCNIQYYLIQTLLKNKGKKNTYTR